MDDIFSLSLFSNINVRNTSKSDVVLYEDHRTILNVLYYLKYKNIIEFPVDLFMFDNHDDGCEPKENAKKKITQFNKSQPTLEKFWTFTEFLLCPQDDDWLKAGMQLGLINNCFLFHSTKTSIGFREDYKTKKFGTKRIYNLGNTWSALGHRGCLSDRIKESYFGELWDDIGWVFENGKFNFRPKNNFVLDFDLDCFSTEILEESMAIPEDLLFRRFKKFSTPSYHDYYSAELFVRDLISKSKLVTICFENGCCGGYKESFKIFEFINYLFFDNELDK